jgi:hypothetical protein
LLLNLDRVVGIILYLVEMEHSLFVNDKRVLFVFQGLQLSKQEPDG